MRSQRWSSERERAAAESRPGRRRFLRLGLGCAVPLAFGGVVRAAGEGLPEVAAQAAGDPVLEHVGQELLRVYHVMRGPVGIKGEHVRVLATNLDLLGAHLNERKLGARADSALRRRLHERGPEAVARDLGPKWSDLRTALGAQYGVAPVADLETTRSAAVMGGLAAQGVVASLRGARAPLFRLAAGFDRPAPRPGSRPVLVSAGQKPGDDFLGYPEPPQPFASWCEALTALLDSIQLTAAVLVMVGAPEAAAALCITGAVLQELKDALCRMMTEP